MSEKNEKKASGILFSELFDVGWLASKRPDGRSVDELIEEKLKELDAMYESGGGVDSDESLRKAVGEYSTDAGDFEVVKAGWQLGVKRYGKKRSVAGIVGYGEWLKYVGLDEETSLKINDWLWDRVFLSRTFDLQKLVDGLVRKFGIEKVQAENIVRTEMANIFNKMREWAYENETKVQKFVWVVHEEACEKCREVRKRSAKGVSLSELKKIVKEVGGVFAREWTVHPQCRCTFVRKAGKRKSWEVPR